MKKLFIDLKKENPDYQWYDGAATIGLTSYFNYGFPLWIRCNNSELSNFTSGDGLTTSITVRVSGRSTTTDENGQQRTYDVEEYSETFGGENTFIRIPKHANYQSKEKVGGGLQDNIQGAVFDLEIDFNISKDFSLALPEILLLRGNNLVKYLPISLNIPSYT